MTALSSFITITLHSKLIQSARYQMTLDDLELLALLLSPAMLMSVLILFTFAAGG
jgi:hypothetical protein